MTSSCQRWSSGPAATSSAVLRRSIELLLRINPPRRLPCVGRRHQPMTKPTIMAAAPDIAPHSNGKWKGKRLVNCQGYQPRPRPPPSKPCQKPRQALCQRLRCRSTFQGDLNNLEFHSWLAGILSMRAQFASYILLLESAFRQTSSPRITGFKIVPVFNVILALHPTEKYLVAIHHRRKINQAAIQILELNVSGLETVGAIR